MINEKYSFKDFMNISFRDVDASEFNDTEIKGSNFYQEAQYDPDSLGQNRRDPTVNIFPPSMRNVTFTGCNLDNVRVVGTNLIVGGSHRKIRVMNDAEDWILSNGNDSPSEPINRKIFELLGLSINPNDIPTVKRDTPITHGDNN